MIIENVLARGRGTDHAGGRDFSRIDAEPARSVIRGAARRQDQAKFIATNRGIAIAVWVAAMKRSKEIIQPSTDIRPAFTFHAVGLPLRAPFDRIIRCNVPLADFHQRKITQEKLAREERELRRLTEAIPGLIAVMTAEGSVEFINKPVQEYFGKTLRDLKDWTITDTVHPDDLPNVVEAWRRSFESGQPYHVDHRCRRADGEYRWFHASGLPLRDDTGRILRWYVLLTDIQEREKAKEKLREDENELRRIRDAIPNMMAVFRPDGTILHLNKIALDYSGLPPEDTEKADYVARFVHPEDVERTKGDRLRALVNPFPFQHEIRILGKDRQYRWFLIRYSPLVDDEGRIVRWYAVGTDIEDRKQAEDRTRNENRALREEVTRSSMFEEIVGSSQPLREVLAQVARVAPTACTVLISGETGTGKELIARAIHRRSNRSTRPFISANCGAIPQSLMSSELFGHERGAFTGAVQRRTGRFEAADGGTIFLDEIGELPMDTQIALLRVLQEREFERIGSSETLKVDVRVIAATNRDLKQAVRVGIFRQDLFYRLNVFPLELPPLRERGNDVQLLANYMLDRFAKKAGKTFNSIAPGTLELLNNYRWPGNVRELQNVIERAVVLCDGPAFSVDSTWFNEKPILRYNRDVQALFVDNERASIEAALAETRGRVSGPSGAAAKLGITRQTLEYKIQRLRINKHRFQA